MPTLTQNSLQMHTNKCGSKCAYRSPNCKNCESDTISLLPEVFGTPSKQCANDTAVIATDDVLGTTELAAIDINSIPQQNALFYVGGYICKTYPAKHSCKECTSSLAWAELSYLSDFSTIRF